MNLTPEQIRDANWAELKDQVAGDRERCWTSLMLWARPITTRQLAARMEMDLLTVRPRVTELVQLGFARCVGKDGHEGLYEAVSLADAQAEHERRRAGVPVQCELF
jgi:hypothetical protein